MEAAIFLRCSKKPAIETRFPSRAGDLCSISDRDIDQIEEARNNVSRAAELLGLERSHLYRKMKALGIGVRE
jgi:transcriptional regulator of acetoin/glycerol metabolism